MFQRFFAAESKNYKSATGTTVHPLLSKIFLDELRSGQISRQGFKLIQIHAIGAVPKKGSATPRPITDCSRPLLDSLNSYMELEPFSFESLDKALSLSGLGTFYAIVDLKSAYRYVPVYPPYRQLQGFRWSFDEKE